MCLVAKLLDIAIPLCRNTSVSQYPIPLCRNTTSTPKSKSLPASISHLSARLSNMYGYDLPHLDQFISSPSHYKPKVSLQDSTTLQLWPPLQFQQSRMTPGEDLLGCCLGLLGDSQDITVTVTLESQAEQQRLFCCLIINCNRWKAA